MIKFKSLNLFKNVWLTSDTHYAHKNICSATSTWDDKSGCRIHNSLEEMNTQIVTDINDYVKEEDVLIHMGDVTFGGKENYQIFLNRLKCKNFIHLQGNHDHHHPDKNQIDFFQFKGFKFACCHYPMLVWHQSHKNVPLAFGHVHGSNPGVGKSLDVGIEESFRRFGSYRPFNYAEFKLLTDSKTTYLESHHNFKTC